MKKYVLSVEQARELMKIGINMSTARMFWLEHDNLDRGYVYTLEDGYCDEMPGDCIPTFTLQDILDCVPDDVYCQGGMPYRFTAKKLGEKTCFGYIPDEDAWPDYNKKSWLADAPEFWFDDENVLDSAFNMLKWLKEKL